MVGIHCNMAAKDLDDVFMNLNLEFVDLRGEINALTQKYDDLEKELKQQKGQKYQCIKCKEKFDNTKQLQKHKER